MEAWPFPKVFLTLLSFIKPRVLNVLHLMSSGEGPWTNQSQAATLGSV